jgi:micrococcal nuclease
MSKNISRPKNRAVNLSKKLIIVPPTLLIGISSLVVGTKYEKEIKQILNQPQTVNKTTEIKVLPKDGVIERVIDGDTIALRDGTMVRYQGVNAPNSNEPFYKEATEANKKLVENKQVTLQYDAYTSDRFGRILAYVFVGDKNISVELVKQGLAKVAIYEDRRKLIYQDEFLKAEQEAKNKKLGVWK